MVQTDAGRRDSPFRLAAHTGGDTPMLGDHPIRPLLIAKDIAAIRAF
jgi:hypothetical protein